jgi:hypothetical protein
MKSLVERMSECRVNQVVQLYNSQLRTYVESRIMEDGMNRGFQLTDTEGWSDFMGWKDSFDRASMKGLRINYSPWNDAFIAVSRLEIKLNHLVDKGT